MARGAVWCGPVIPRPQAPCFRAVPALAVVPAQVPRLDEQGRGQRFYNSEEWLPVWRWRLSLFPAGLGLMEFFLKVDVRISRFWCILTNTETGVNCPEQVDPVTRRVHWTRASESRLYFVLIGCSEIRTVSARLVLNTCSNATAHIGVQ